MKLLRERCRKTYLSLQVECQKMEVTDLVLEKRGILGSLHFCLLMFAKTFPFSGSFVIFGLSVGLCETKFGGANCKCAYNWVSF